MKNVNTHEAKTNLSALLQLVEKSGETVQICRNGKPIADLIPHRQQSRVKPHPVMSRIKLNYDPTEAVGPDDWPGER